MDNVNHPTHYADKCSLECFQVMRLIFDDDIVFDFCLLNAFKYMWRYKYKNGDEDLKKADWYLKKAKEIEPKIDYTDYSDVFRRLELLRDELKGE